VVVGGRTKGWFLVLGFWFLVLGFWPAFALLIRVNFWFLVGSLGSSLCRARCHVFCLMSFTGRKKKYFILLCAIKESYDSIKILLDFIFFNLVIEWIWSINFCDSIIRHQDNRHKSYTWRPLRARKWEFCLPENFKKKLFQNKC
jgi:hypothetical protein